MNKLLSIFTLARLFSCNRNARFSPYMGYFSKYPDLVVDDGSITEDLDASGNATFMELQELSLSLTTGQGEILIVGCSHSGLCVN